MYNIIIFGVGITSNTIVEALKENISVVAYLDNDKNTWNKKINGVEVINPIDINKYDFDVIVIASQYNDEIYEQLIKMNINRKKILEFYKFMDNMYNYYRICIDSFFQEKGIEVLVTGISYAASGFCEKFCCKKSFKLALYSQDLYYDYKTVKFLINNYPVNFNDIKYVIIGLSYYSFEYDLSLSSMKYKVPLYYSLLKDKHNLRFVENIEIRNQINKSIAEKIFVKNSDGVFHFKWNHISTTKTQDKWNIGLKQAKKDCDKNYPETVTENIQIFKEYLEFLKEHNIKPIVAVFPTSKYYNTHFSERIENEFHCIINEVKKDCDFQYIDYFRSELFKDEDFQDVSHLNAKGAEKFTKILNETIEW